jgi:hypothetical protein
MTIGTNAPNPGSDSSEVAAALVHCLQGVAEKLGEDKVLSRWNLEVLLDALASAVTNHLASRLPEAGPIGCSIVYGVLPRSYNLGGASKDRRKMEFEARYYRLEDHWLRSLTAFSIATRTGFVLDDFDTACIGLKEAGLTHESKDCETEAAKTKSYCCIPIARDGSVATRFIRSSADVLTICASDATLRASMEKKVLPGPADSADGGAVPDDHACGALRFTSENPGVASQLRAMLDEVVWRETLLGDLAQLIRSGISKAGGSDNEAVLLKVLADFLQELPDWRGSEFHAFNQLTLLLQCMFDACEVSVFEAHREVRGKDKDIVTLRLAATTALSDKPGSQHVKFRDWFYGQDKHYRCSFVSGTNTSIPGMKDYRGAGKTARAYYNWKRPYFEEIDTESVGHHGHNEIPEGQTASFLAFAIPPLKEDSYSLPYGVVRIVSGRRNVLAEKHKEMAGAVGAGLRLLWEHFPSSEQLEVHWQPGEGQTAEDRAASYLAKLVDGDHATDEVVKREFSLLLRKLFFDHAKATVVTCKADEANGLHLGVRLDDDSDEGVTVRRKHKSERYERLSGQDWRETRHLMGRITSTESALAAPLMRNL